MAIIDGIQPLGFGTTTVAGYVVEGITEPTTSESLQISDEDGDWITDINAYAIMTEVELEVIPKVSTVAPVMGDTFTYTSKTHGAGQKITVKEISAAEVQKDVVKWSIKGSRYPAITL